MRNAGKILVLVNFGLSLMFLGIAVLTHATRSRVDANGNWVELSGALAKERTVVQGLDKQLADLKALVEKASTDIGDEKKDLARAKTDNEAREKGQKGEINRLEEDVKTARKQADDLIEKSQTSSKTQVTRRQEAQKLESERSTQSAQNDTLLKQKRELENELAQAQNILGLANRRNEGLKETIRAYEQIEKNGSATKQ